MEKKDVSEGIVRGSQSVEVYSRDITLKKFNMWGSSTEGT